jgi:hypothetical protein
MSSASATDDASGFSMKRWVPARAATSATSRWRALGLQTNTARGRRASAASTENSSAALGTGAAGSRYPVR